MGELPQEMIDKIDSALDEDMVQKSVFDEVLGFVTSQLENEFQTGFLSSPQFQAMKDEVEVLEIRLHVDVEEHEHEHGVADHDEHGTAAAA